MKFYIASRFTNQELVKKLSCHLTKFGHEQTYDWTQNIRAESFEDLSAIGQLEKNAVSDCDAFFILLPGGKGSHIELGLALAGEKKVYLFSESDVFSDVSASTTFYHLPEVERVIGNLEDLVEIVVAAFGTSKPASPSSMLE